MMLKTRKHFIKIYKMLPEKLNLKTIQFIRVELFKKNYF